MNYGYVGHFDLSNLGYSMANVQLTDSVVCYRQLPVMDQYYHEGNSKAWQAFDTELPEELQKLPSLIPHGFTDYTLSVIRIDPGNTVPLHLDKFYKIRSRYPHQEIKPWRFLVFLEDWKSGHYFEINEEAVTGWSAGDVWKFTDEVWHLGLCGGTEPFWSAQITGIF